MDYTKLIRIINEELHELIPDQDVISFIEENPPLSFESIGYAHIILFLGYPIWQSENDERPFENEDNPELCDYIPLETWLWQEIKRILLLIKQFSEILNKDNRKMTDKMFPSKYGIGDPVNVCINDCIIEGNIRTVLFSNMKVRYSVSIMHLGDRTTLHNLDSILVEDNPDGKFIDFGDDNYS